MYFPDKAKIGIEGKSYNHRCQHFHETTSDFMLPNVPFIKKIKGKTNIQNMVVEYYSRCNPMPIPTMGIAYTKLNWYFVPFRILWKGYEAFKSRSYFYYNNAVSGVTKKPSFKMEDVNIIITNPANGFMRPHEYDATQHYDLIYTNANNETYGYNFTKAGMQWYTIWCQLGYNIGNQDFKRRTFNALPLLAFCKVIADCYTPRAFADYEQNYVKLYALLNSPMIDYTLQLGELLFLFNWFTVVCYEDDYFNSAWLNPNGPNDGYISIGRLPVFMQDANSNPTISYVTDNGNNAVITFAGQDDMLTNEHINVLKAYDKYLKKNQIVGTKYWDRLLAHYGITTDKALLNVPELIKSDKIYYKFNEIYSTTQNASGDDGAELGAYAGNGETFVEGGANTQTFNYFAEEEGYLICIATNEPEIAYGNGFDKDVLDLEVLEDYTEEFDGEMIEPIDQLEIYSGYDAPNKDWYTAGIWGFVNKYARQKITISKCTGLMNMNSKKASMARWNFMRWYGINDFRPIVSGQPAVLVQNSIYNCLGYGEGLSDNHDLGSQYSRIFYTDNEPNFNMYFRFTFNMRNSMKPYYYEDNLVDDDDKVINVDAH